MRTPRTRALELGTDPKGFVDAVVGDEDYCPQCGHPLGLGHPHSHYSDSSSGARIQPGGDKPSAGSTPFKLGG